MDGYTAIVIIHEDDVEQVCVVPNSEATFDNIQRLRDIVRTSQVGNVRIQHVPVTHGDAQHFGSVCQVLATFLRTHMDKHLAV